MIPNTPIAWLYVARGMFNSKPPRYRHAIEACQYCLRHQDTIRESQHIMAWCLHELGEGKAALEAFHRSCKLGNETDWQMIVELEVRAGAVQETQTSQPNLT